MTGASGTGKSTITGPLRQPLPDCEVFEADTTLHIAALGWDTWRNTWLQLADAIALNGRATVLTGSLIPAQLQDLPARRLLGPVHFATLDCPAGMLAERLRARPAWRGTSGAAKLAEHQQFAAWLRANIQPTFDTGDHTADDVATQVAARVTALLPALLRAREDSVKPVARRLTPCCARSSPPSVQGCVSPTPGGPHVRHWARA